MTHTAIRSATNQLYNNLGDDGITVHVEVLQKKTGSRNIQCLGNAGRRIPEYVGVYQANPGEAVQICG